MGGSDDGDRFEMLVTFQLVTITPECDVGDRYLMLSITVVVEVGFLLGTVPRNKYDKS